MENTNFARLKQLFHFFGKQQATEKMFFDNDYPYPFENKDGHQLLIYPATMELYFPFNILAQSLTIDKNRKGGIEAISQSYLSYILWLAEKGDANMIYMLCELLLIVLHLERTYKVKNEEGIEEDKPTIEIGRAGKDTYIEILGERYSSRDFDEIRRIILLQNDIELIDEKIHPDLIDAYEKWRAWKARQSKFKLCDIADQMNIVICFTSYTKEQLLQMSIRTFFKLLERIDLVVNYQIEAGLTPWMSKDGAKSITHYLSETKSEDKFKEMFTDYDSVEKKINGAK